MTDNDFDLYERIDVVTARKLIEIVTTLARSCSFNNKESMEIAQVCDECLKRMNDEQESGGIE